MEARLTIYKLGGAWWWELRSHNDALMTSDRYVDGGEASTQPAAFADADIAWRRFWDYAQPEEKVA